MLNSPTNSPREDAKDALERLNNWINVLEKRIYALLDTNDPELMSPAQREQAANSHLTVLHRYYQLRQEYVALSDDRDDPAIVHALIHGHDEIDDFE